MNIAFLFTLQYDFAVETIDYEQFWHDTERRAISLPQPSYVFDLVACSFAELAVEMICMTATVN